MPLPTVLEELLSLPTAAFAEHVVLEYIEHAIKALPNTTSRHDEHGNLFVHYRNRTGGAPPICLTAHTDHPGFVALKMLDERTLLAAFRGWVEPQYFHDERVRFWSDGRWIKGRVHKIVKSAPIVGIIGRTGRPEEVEIRVKEPVAPNSPGMWNLPDPKERDGRVYARGCDDIAGCAALLAMFQRLAEKNAAADVYGLFTRAEEVGFVGAIGAARSGTIPRDTPVIAIETSKEIPGVKMGDGPVLRVGDRTSVFTPSVTAFVDRVAKELVSRTAPPAEKPAKSGKKAQKAAKAKRPSKKALAAQFRYQRKLMDGGTCESTAYMVYGYPTTGICVALGNYHNMNAKRGRIASEYISLSDWERMVDWFEALALDDKGVDAAGSTLRADLDKRFAEYEPLLR